MGSNKSNKSMFYGEIHKSYLEDFLEELYESIDFDEWQEAFPSVSGYECFSPHNFEECEANPHAFRSDEQVIASELVKYPEFHNKMISIIAFIMDINKRSLMWELYDDEEYPGTTVANCGFGRNNNTAYQTCWAIREFPYTNHLLNHSSHSNPDQHPYAFPPANNQQVKFICPNILNADSNAVAKLQAKLRFMIENQGIEEVPSSTHFNAYSIRNNTENAQTTSNGIDGSVGQGTKNWVKALIKTYQDSLDENNANKVINIDSQNSETPDYAQLLINRICSTTQALSNNVLVDATFDWFNTINFDNISLNV